VSGLAHADAHRLLLEVTKKVPEKVLRAYGSVVQAKKDRSASSARE
jgi:hypothetical protein